MVRLDDADRDARDAASGDVPLPPMRLRLHKDTDENFRDMGSQLAAVLYRLGLRDTDSLLDVGCGVGRLPIGLLSIFTHFEAGDIASYLRELHRVLEPGGTVIATWFLWDEERRRDVESGAYPMVHQRDAETLYADESDPLWAIAHHIDRVRAMVADAGLQIERIELGTWAHGPGPELQDVVVLRKPAAPPADRRRLRDKIATLGQRARSGR